MFCATELMVTLRSISVGAIDIVTWQSPAPRTVTTPVLESIEQTGVEPTATEKVLTPLLSLTICAVGAGSLKVMLA